ncbi:MAG: MFS transporter [bacterium]|nr:MFS transporter [bacterium]
MNRNPWPAVIAVGVLLTVSFGSILYGFSIYVTDSAAGAEFSSSMLSLAYGGSVIVSGVVATPLGRWMDRHGTRWVALTGGVVTCAGLVGFSLADNRVALVAVWWLLVGPGTAMVFYEPAFVVINQLVTAQRRPHALGVVTVIGGFAGAIFIPLIEAMNSSLGWRPTVRILGGVIAVLGVAAATLTPRRSAEHAAEATRSKVPFAEIVSDRRFLYLTGGLILLFLSVNGLLAHRVDRFTEAGFEISTVAWMAGAASLVSMPGRFFGPVIAGRKGGLGVLEAFVAVMVVAIALTIPSGPGWFMPGHFVLFGLAFGAILPLRAVVMDQWYGRNHYGRRMGIQQTGTLMIGGLGALIVGVLRDVTGAFVGPMSLLLVAAGLGLGLIMAAGRVPATPVSQEV